MIDIACNNVSKTFPSGLDTIYALSNISFNIPKNSFTCIIGESGSGKTTLLNLIAGLDTPTKGSILMDGQDLNDFNEKKMDAFRNKEMGFIFQNFMLLNDFTALENVMLPHYILTGNKNKAKTKAMELLEAVNLKERALFFPTKLSGGEAQRIAICRAIINEPGLILADEPTGNLDEKNQQVVMDLLLNLKKTKDFTLIMVTHNLELSKKADNIIKLSFGKLI